MKYERNAVVRVEGEDNSSYPLSETSTGNYSTPQLFLNNNVKYRLYIKTSDGKEYNSEYTTRIKTPPIDAVRWEQPTDLYFYINTHDPLNNTRYYQWDWEETWEFHSAFSTTLEYARSTTGEITGIKYRYPNQMHDTTNYICWRTEASTSILIGSSAKLAKDSIDMQIHSIKRASQKVSVLYSIKVRQHALSKARYEFLQRMKKNTEQTGTLFDAQPSELVGNIHAKNDPKEIVIGLVEVSDMQEKRIFIRMTDLLNWGFRQPCEEIRVPNNLDSIRAHSYLTPTNVAEFGVSGILAFLDPVQPVSFVR
ncbi:DUF4249 domain-containing protein [Paraflavitalea speifideaquila]|uniref:DUF4249 domain-containing protein n=1 Tax=Paraflavitalea speifideaquila TaxID=3076558 RepID=UPI0028EB625E|nr:DUF4249 domain-containing protein [Paraflavitalea speifideiaquila]